MARYTDSQRYVDHFDAVDPHSPAGRSFCANGGQRVATVLMYLNDVREGGSTFFRLLDLAIQVWEGALVCGARDENVAASHALPLAFLPISSPPHTPTHTPPLPLARNPHASPHSTTAFGTQPKKGNALIFFPGLLNGELDEDLLHAAMPAVDTKWVAQVALLHLGHITFTDAHVRTQITLAVPWPCGRV